MLDITQFGAGDNRVNNAPALDKAMEHLLNNRNDYTIYFPSGKYLFSARLN